MLGLGGVGKFGSLPEPPAAGTDHTLVCLSLTLHRATTHSCGHPATGSALISHAPSERRQSHGTRPSDRTKRQSQMNAGGARSAALGGREGHFAPHLMFFVLAVVPKGNTTTVVAELFVPVPKFQDENLLQGRRCAPYEKTNNMGKAWALEVKKYTVRLDAQGSLDSRLH